MRCMAQKNPYVDIALKNFELGMQSLRQAATWPGVGTTGTTGRARRTSGARGAALGTVGQQTGHATTTRRRRRNRRRQAQAIG